MSGMPEKIRRVSLPAVASLWAVALAVAGLWAMLGGVELPGGAGVPLGVAAFGAGQVVFLTIVADRLWRPGARPVGLALQCFWCLALLGALLVGVGALLDPAGRMGA
ncbi:MAG: hypothetical protein AAFP26_01805 [Planctomycetota bacterium]